jgi:Rieske Fe-S protein
VIPRGAEVPRETERETVPPDGRPIADQPKWRRDFPIAWSRDEYVSRRDLVKFIVMTSGAFAVGQVWLALKTLFGARASAPSAATPIASATEVPVGGAKTFVYPEGSTPRLLVRTGDESFVAYDQLCTHLNCPVVPAVDKGKLHCPCHNGWFDLGTGEPVAGPPQRPLTRVRVELRGDTVYATGVEEPST